MIVHRDCRYYMGDRPCRPHKEEGVHCDQCAFYQSRGPRYCILKLGAIGDVLRTTHLLRRIRQEHPLAKIYWLTHTVDVLPSLVDVALPFSLESVLLLEETEFDFLFSLDKDPEACALANRIRAKVRKGFFWKDGACEPLDDGSHEKWLTGLFDDVNKENTKSYPQEVFEMCGYSFAGEPYVLEIHDLDPWKGIPHERPLVGLNTGCGDRWATRLWPERHWEALALKLRESGYGVLLLGGEQEDEKNRRIAGVSGAAYPGTFPLHRFFSLMNQCDLVVTSASLALHAALGLGKKVALFNNVFNRMEFELYGLGEILEPEGYDCIGCFRTACKTPCMESILPDRVFKAVEGLIQETSAGKE